MTEEAKLIVDTLRYCEESGARCGGCPSGHDESGIPRCHRPSNIADLIESLRAQLEQVTRERDAAVQDLEMCCHCETCTRSCKYDKVNAYDECADFEWRGVEVEE